MRTGNLWFVGITLLFSAMVANCGESRISFETPEEFEIEKPFTVKIKVSGVPADQGLKLGADLHWMKADGNYGGLMAWGGNHRPVSGEQTLSFTYKPVAKEGLGCVVVTAFISKTGAFQDAIQKASSKEIRPKGMEVPKEAVAKKDRSATVTFKKSWISYGANRKGAKKTDGEVWTEGDDWILPIEYYVDPEDDWGGTQLQVWVAGPWVDCPDGKYTKVRSHHNYSGLGGTVNCKIGEKTVHEFKWKIPATMKSKTGLVGDELLPIAFFKGADGNNWPWQVRGGGPGFSRRDGFFEVDSDTPGNLFTYDQPVVMHAMLKNVTAKGTAKKLSYTVTNVRGTTVVQGTVDFTIEKDGQKVAIPLTIEQRGTFAIRVEVPGWEARETSFCRIPDLMKITAGAKTAFGTQCAFAGNPGAQAEENMRIMRLLGLTIHRTWLGWGAVQPWKDEWRGIDEWRATLALARKHGIDPWICLVDPPMWVLDKVPARSFNFAAFPFRDEDLTKAVTRLTTEFKGNFIGWEWLNEIVPGSISPDPVSDYVRFCKVATAASKKVAPNLVNSAAGGLFPRSFRKSLLAAGLAKHIDVLPIHYSSAGGVMEAEEDLAVVGAKKVVVWDNETGRGVSTWHMPLAEAMKITEQSNWILTNWTDELMVGCQKLVYFTGGPNAAGNWSYLWGDASPRPLAATLAVFTSKLFDAKPFGGFMLGSNGLLHLFQKKDGSSLLVVSSHAKGGETVSLQVGIDRVTVTDYQGQETELKAPKKLAALKLEDLRYFVEGGDLDVLKAYVVPSVVMGSATEKSAALMQLPRMTILHGKSGEFFVRMRNLYERKLSGSLTVQGPKGWPASEPVAYNLAKGESEMIPLAFTPPTDVKPGAYDLAVRIHYDEEKLPDIRKPFALTIISPDMLGNLFANAGFEEAGGNQEQALHWGAFGVAKRVPYIGKEPGHGGHVFEIAKADKWSHLSQACEKIRPGQTYLYTAWAHSDQMEGGSNVYINLKSGKAVNLYTPSTFMFVPGQSWYFYTCKIHMPDDAIGASFTPTATGKGFARYDNLRLTVYEGTNFAAECHQTKGPITVDGDLREWDDRCPIPLFSGGQLVKFQDGYKRTTKNLGGVAYLRWDKKGVYLAAEIVDDKHVATETNENTVNGDSLVLAMHPANRTSGTSGKAFAYYLSSVKGGGGSGAHTVYRPPSKSGGLTSGQLAKDSSVYEFAVKSAEGRTIYEFYMPYSELGGVQGEIGTKIGLSLQLNDNDGAGRGACMLWGGGVQPTWEPSAFGVVTFVK